LSELRVPPNSLEAEQSVLGGLLLDNVAFDKIADLISEGDFYRDEHRRIYRQISQTARTRQAGRCGDRRRKPRSGRRGQRHRRPGLSRRTGGEHAVGGEYPALRRDRSRTSDPAATGDGGRRDRRQMRSTRSVAMPKTLLDEAEAKVFAIAEGGFRHQSGFVHINPLLTQVVERIQELHDRDNPSDITGVPSGYHDLDAKTSGLQGGDLLIVAGRPSMGKTSFALNIAEHVAIEVGLPVAIFSMEMGGTQLAMRMLSSVGRLDAHRVRTGRLNDDEWSRLSFALGKMHEAPIYIDETPALNPIDLRARARRLHRQCGKLGLVVIDYLQLMSATSQGENRATEDLGDFAFAERRWPRNSACP
jgi:replicative DNA helicase